ncbi:MAG: hypothetical protein K9G30_02795 [Parvibaculum sp.]|nr:hypothetical protein [Parvibaculum sp.]
MSQSRVIWLLQVSSLMQKLYGIDHVDAGWDQSDIDRYFEFGSSPEEFVEWYGAKYGLDTREAWT